MTPNTQTPEERKRMHAEMLQDPQYAKSRRMLLWVSVLSAFFLAGSGLMVSNDKLSLEGATMIIGSSVLLYFYSMVSLVRHRNNAEARWWSAKNAKRDAKQEAKREKKRKGGR